MRYSKDHKAKTHQRIVEEAAQRFRRDGIGATGLQSLMKALGLTHGGFYAHFKSKDDLVETALRHAALQSGEAVQAPSADEAQLTDLIARYLSPAHRAKPGDGCPLPTMSAELGQRGEPSVITDEIVKDRLALIEAGLREEEDAAEESVVMLAAMVGALQLSRSVKNRKLSDRILKTTRELLLQKAGSAAP
jgi:AcrR family transcriptional regulator